MTIWASWLFIELYNGSGVVNGGANSSLFYGAMVGGGVGLVIGMAIGISIYLVCNVLIPTLSNRLMN